MPTAASAKPWATDVSSSPVGPLVHAGSWFADPARRATRNRDGARSGNTIEKLKRAANGSSRRETVPISQATMTPTVMAWTIHNTRPNPPSGRKKTGESSPMRNQEPTRGSRKAAALMVDATSGERRQAVAPVSTSFVSSSGVGPLATQEASTENPFDLRG